MSRELLAWSLLVFLLVPLVSYSQIEVGIKLAPQGEKIAKEKIAAVPPFDKAKAAQEAETLCPLYKVGDRVSVNYRNMDAEGVFRGIKGKFLIVGDRNIPLMDVSGDQLIRFLPDQTQRLRDQYVQRKVVEYNTMLNGIRRSIATEFPAFPEKYRTQLFLELPGNFSVEFEELYNSKLPLPDGTSITTYIRNTLDIFLADHPEVVLANKKLYLKDDWEKRKEQILAQEEQKKQEQLAQEELKKQTNLAQEEQEKAGNANSDTINVATTSSPMPDAKGNAYKTISFGDDFKTVQEKYTKIGGENGRGISNTNERGFASTYYDSLPPDDVSIVESYLRSEKGILLRGACEDNYYQEYSNPEAPIFWIGPYDIGLLGVILNLPDNYDINEVLKKIESDGGFEQEPGIEKISLTYFGMAKDTMALFEIPYYISIPYKLYRKTENGIQIKYFIEHEFRKSELQKFNDEETEKLIIDVANRNNIDTITCNATILEMFKEGSKGRKMLDELVAEVISTGSPGLRLHAGPLNEGFTITLPRGMVIKILSSADDTYTVKDQMMKTIEKKWFSRVSCG